MDAAFRASWLEAIAIAYQRLELVLLERAFNGAEKLMKRQDGSEERMREYSNQLGFALLKMHRDTAQSRPTPSCSPSDIEEIRERLIQKLRRLKERRDAEREAPGCRLGERRRGSRRIATSSSTRRTRQRGDRHDDASSDMIEIDADFESWAHKNQLPPQARAGERG